MWKKIALGFVALIVAIFVLLFWQISRVEQELTQRLHDNHITAHHISMALFPQPVMTLTNVTWQDSKGRSILAEKVALHLDIESLFHQPANFQQLTFHDVNIRTAAPSESALHIIHGQITGEFLIQPTRITFKKANLSAEFGSPLLFATQQVQLSAQTGWFEQLSETDTHILLETVNLNNEMLAKIEARLVERHNQQLLSLNVDYTEHQPSLQLDGTWQTEGPHQKSLVFEGKNIDVAKGQNILNLPHLFVGYTDIAGELTWSNHKVQGGKVKLAIPQGQVKGMDLIALSAKYLPINYDKAQLNSQQLTTSFQNLHAHVSWDNAQLHLQRLDFDIDKVNVSGEGHVNLADLQCDITLRVGLVDPKYHQFALPIHFFDHCDSPQYKIELNQRLRNKIKDLLKEKFR
ncbi:hypothetical protein ACWIT3_06270 [Pasteurella sp. P03HT]